MPRFSFTTLVPGFALLAALALAGGCAALDIATSDSGDALSRQSALAGLPSPAEQVALQTAARRQDLYQVDGVTPYRGIYNGPDGDCDLVTVERAWDAYRSRVDLINYRVCAGRIDSEAETRWPDPRLPFGTEHEARQVAREAVRPGGLGVAERTLLGYRLTARALPDPRHCRAEVRIFQGLTLVWQGEQDGCR